MKGYNFCTLIFVSLLALSAQKEILSPDNDICRLVPDGTLLRKPGTCNEGIECRDHKSKDYKTCSGTLGIWGRAEKKCVSKTSDTYCGDPCGKSSPQFVVDKKNCNGWYKCNGEKVAGSGHCNSGLVFNQTTQLCVYPSQSTCVATYEICDVAPNDVKIQDVENCHKYFTCKDNKGTKQENTCETGKYYDVDSGTCIPKAQVDCYKHPYPDDVCGTTKLAIRDRFVSDGATCNGWFYCRNLGNMNTPDKAPQWGTCNDGLFFNEAEQSCMDRKMVACNEDRCVGISDGETISSRVGCKYYLTCRDGLTVEETKCPLEYYYNIEKGCTIEKVVYPACKA